MYYPPVIHLAFSPSNFLTEVNTTVLAGIFRPMEKVSVENKILSNPSWNNSSITYFNKGKSPP
jgi:hypothetical protein